MNKFLFVFVSLCLFAPIQGLRKNRLLESLSIKRRLNGDLHPNHRRLSNNGQLHLKINGRGYFQFRLRVEETDASGDESQLDAGSTTNYNQGYSKPSALDITNIDTDKNEITLTENTPFAIKKGQRVAIRKGAADTADCALEGSYTVVNDVATTQVKVVLSQSNKATLWADGTSQANCELIINPTQNDNANPGTADDMGVEAAEDGDDNYFSQVVYGTDGSLHVNKYGYLVDDNGLLLVSDATNKDIKEADGSAVASRSGDDNAKYHIHIPSRADGILVTPTGKVKAIELGGAAFSQVGQIKLARFENAQGLNIRLKMNSNCNAANEDGFALGNWCAGTALDGKEHVYYAETKVSGKGIVGNPGSQGFGRIVKVY